MADWRDLITERLLVRPLASTDLEAFAAYRSDPDVARYQGWAVPYPVADAQELLAAQDGVAWGEPGRWLQLAMIDRATGALLGDCGVRVLGDTRATAELGMTLAPARQHAGIAAEAGTAVLDALFTDLAMHRVIAQIDERNVAAQRLVARLGLRHEATFVDADWFKGEWTTLCVHAVLASEWAARSGR